MPVGHRTSEWSHTQIICEWSCNSRLDTATAVEGSFSSVQDISAEKVLKEVSELEHVGVE